MGMFGNLFIGLVVLNIVFALFGIITPSENIIATLISGEGLSPKYLWDVFLNSMNPENNPGGLVATIFGGLAIIIGMATKRDDLIYAPLVVLLLNFLGIFSIFSVIFPPQLKVIGIIIQSIFIVLFTWSAIEWLRGLDR
jgi:hypothetical protein